ncbi:MAG: glycosyltransferase family 4 protein, partial [Tepidisphaeraceae bacterium]
LFNAVDTDRYQPRARASGGSINVLFVGQDFERKGLQQLIDAFLHIEDHRLKLTIVGGDKRWHLPLKSITQVGATSDTRPYYRAADFFVLPTRHDPCSLVVLEALAMGLPVISTKFNGATEIMTDGVHGYVLDDPSAVPALADAMQKLMDPQRRAEMSKACLELRPRLSYEHHLDRLEEIYRSVLKPKSLSP